MILHLNLTLMDSDFIIEHKPLYIVLYFKNLFIYII